MTDEAPKSVTLSVELIDAHARSLAQFLKRAGLADFRSNAQHEDEAYTMLDAAERVRAALAATGYAPH